MEPCEGGPPRSRVLPPERRLHPLIPEMPSGQHNLTLGGPKAAHARQTSADDENRHVPSGESWTKAPVTSSELAPNTGRVWRGSGIRTRGAGLPAPDTSPCLPAVCLTPLPASLPSKTPTAGCWPQPRGSLESCPGSEPLMWSPWSHRGHSCQLPSPRLTARGPCSGVWGGISLVLNVLHDSIHFPQTELRGHSSPGASTPNHARRPVSQPPRPARPCGSHTAHTHSAWCVQAAWGLHLGDMRLGGGRRHSEGRFGRPRDPSQ